MSGWIKRLRQKLRNRRPALILASLLLLLSLTWVVVQEREQSKNDDSQAVLAPQKWQVVIQKNYVAGPMTEEKQEFNSVDIDQIITALSTMQMVEQGENYAVFAQKVDDISPVIKESGFFALDQQGMLHLYKGEIKDENIIQTFFQIDMERLETSVPMEEYMQLREGIHISSLAEYNRVLSTYSEFAVLSQEERDSEEH